MYPYNSDFPIPEQPPVSLGFRVVEDSSALATSVVFTERGRWFVGLLLSTPKSESLCSVIPRGHISPYVSMVFFCAR